MEGRASSAEISIIATPVEAARTGRREARRLRHVIAGIVGVSVVTIACVAALQARAVGVCVTEGPAGNVCVPADGTTCRDRPALPGLRDRKDLPARKDHQARFQVLLRARRRGEFYGA